MKKDILMLAGMAIAISTISQNVGIGTATPLEKLSVVSVGGYGISHESSSIKLSTYIDGSGGYFGTITNSPFHLYTNNGSAQFTLLQNGNVGIGNINPVNKLDVNGNILSVGNITANAFNFPSAKIYYYSLSRADFIEVASGSIVQTEGISGGGLYMTGSPSTSGFVAPVHLPEGATVTRMTVYFKDASASINLEVFFQISHLITQMAGITSSGTPGEISLFDNTILTPTIFHATNAYVIYARPVGGQWPGTDIILRSIIVEYTLPGL